MTNHLEKVIARLDSQVCRIDQVQVVVSPPLNARAFRDQRGRPRWWPGRRRYREFARIQDYTPDDYEEFVSLPILGRIQALRERGAAVVVEGTFADFRNGVEDSSCHLLFLVAHHVKDFDDDARGLSSPGVEFADGVWPWGDVQRALLTASRKRPLSLVFSVCETDEVVVGWYTSQANLGALGFSGGQVPLLDCVSFLYRWVLHLDGRRTVADALHLASVAVLKQSGPPEALMVE